tara:strand:+ start:501 stop:1115 length:615 start_codon:yes stop_codon:yes gene_type:complete
MNFEFKNYRIKSTAWNTSRSWGHESILYVDGFQVQRKKLTYYNRTWEDFKFQTCMRIVVEDYLDAYLVDYESAFKHSHNKKRLSAKLRKQMMEQFKKETRDVLWTPLFGDEKKVNVRSAYELLDAIEHHKPETDGRLNAMKGFLALGDLMTNKTESEADAVAYKERIVFATMRSMVPDWREPKDWAQLSNADKMTRLKKLEEVV